MSEEKRKFVEEKWTLFLTMAIQPGISSEALNLMRDTFYSGAAAMFDVMTNNIGEIEETEAACTAIAGIHDELEAHALKIALRAMQARATNLPQG